MGSVYCLCNTNESQRLSAVGSFSAKASKVQSVKQSIINVAKLNVTNSKSVGLVSSLVGEGSVLANENKTHGNPDGVLGLGIISNAHLVVSGVADAALAGVGSAKSLNVDKFAGNFDTLKSIIPFNPQERLYPSSDITTTLSGVGFVDRNLNSSNLYQSIDEGVFAGRYINNNTSSYSKITDDKNTFIQPISTGVDSNLRCRFGVNPVVSKPEDSFFVMRASAPLRNDVAGAAPLYNINNIKLLDPSGDLIIKYKDLNIKGDSVRGQAGISGNFTTYISEPEINLAALNTYDPKYPRIGRHFVGASGYSISFDIDISCMDDPFGRGYNPGHQEFTCSGVSIASGFFLGEQVTTIDNIKISAIEIMNHGSVETVEQQYLNLFSLPVNTGERLIRHIFPTQIFASGFDTTIAPVSISKWQSSAYPDASAVYSNSGTVGASILRDSVLPTYIRLESASVPDSGKLTVKFEDTIQSSTTTIVHGNYDNSAFSIDYNKTKVKTFPLVDSFYSDIDSVKLKVTARKASGSRDFALDVVGYSDDKLLAITNKVGGFLQNTPDSSLSAINSSGTEELGISAGPISNTSNFDLSLSTIPNSGGDHAILSSTPLINSTAFQEYEIPLRIYSIVPKLGRIRKFDQSSFFENIILDIFPIPSGADIADMKLEVQYRPSNALPVSVVGHGRDKPFARNTVILDVEQPLSTYPATNDDHTVTALSSISGIPHGFTSPSSIKTNYSRRWRGISGKEYRSGFGNAFDFFVSKDELRDPFQQGFYNFAITSGNKVFSRHVDLLGEYRSSGLFNATLDNSVYHHLGWRFNSSGILNTARNYRTTDWASGTHPLKGQIADAFSHIVRISGEHGNFTFPNIQTNNSGHFTAFVRFTPDETASGVGYNLFNSGVLVSRHDDFSIRYSGGYLQGTATNTSGNLVLVTDPLAYSGYQYPLSVLLGYDGDTLSLYTDNELSQYEFTKLRSESSSFTKRNTSHDIVLGYSSGDHVGMNMFVSEFGFSSGVVPSGDNESLLTIDDVFDSHRMTFNDRPASPPASGTRDGLWKYLNQSANSSWMLGAFRTCQFDEDFDQLESRTDTTYLEHTFVCDGTDYANNTNITLPTSISTDDLAYHTQIENDFMRFFLKDVPESQGSGQFYSADLRITKNLPRGYNFNEEAFVVETVVDNDMTNLVQWSDGFTGPRLIVSLYAPTKVPAYLPHKVNYGLVNRHIHYLEPSGCYRKLKSTFDSKNLFDTTTEPWSSFEPELYVSEFNHRYFKTDINDMFIQYDIAYPSNTNYESRIRLHTAEVKLAKALVDLPTASGGFDPVFTLAISGDFAASNILEIYTNGYSPLEFNAPSGLTLFGSGLTPSGAESTPSGLYLSLPSGRWPHEAVNLYMDGHLGVSTSDSFAAWQAGDPVIGLSIFVNNDNNLVTSGESLTLNTFNNDPYPSATSSLELFTSHRGLIPSTNSLNVSTRGPRSSFTTAPTGHMFMMTQATGSTQAYTVNPFNFFIKSIPSGLNNDFGLYTLNMPAIDVNVDQQQSIQWNGDNVGSDILVTNNNYSALSADDEIRGVTTICFGSCESSGICSTKRVYTHGIDWNSSDCIHGGIARAQTLYTNSGVVAFGGDTNGYDNHFYAIRKYTGLIPSYPYTITIGGFTGSNELIDVPRIVTEVEYGSSDEVNYSGIKHFYHNPQAVHAKYGKDVVIRGDLMAIGAPQYTLTDSSGDISDAGAVFLYRRSSAPSGNDWSSQADKSPWNLEQILTLPSGFQRDYKHQDYGAIEDELGTFFSATKNYWSIGQLGRNFGYSVDIVSDPNVPSGDKIVVGAPRGVFDRNFEPLSARKITMCLLVITDNVNSPSERIEDLNKFIASRNRYFLHVADPPFQIVPKYIILSATKNTVLNNGTIFGNESIGDEFVGGYIDQITHPASGSVQSPEIEGQIKDFFNDTFTPTGTLPNSGLPAILGVFVDGSASMGRELVTPAIDNFIQYYKTMSESSGVRNHNDANATSGIVYDLSSSINRENWEDAAYELSRGVMSNDAVLNNIDIFTSGYSEAFVPDNVRFQVLPPSGGRVYVFEQDVVKSGIFYDTNKPMFELTHTFGLDRYEFDGNNPNERFGHDVSISKNSEFIAIGSPYYKKGVSVYRKNQDYNLNSLYSTVENWISSKISEDPSDISNIYHTLNTKYNTFNDGSVSRTQIGKAIYELLNPSGRMSLRVFKESQLGFEEKYQKVFDYKNDYNITGSWTFVPEFHAPVPRVGYSVALSESGDMLAVGCPTDSMNQFDDANIYHKNTKLCPNDLGIDGLGFVPGYVSPIDSESDLVTGALSNGGVEGTLQSYVNAGAVQLFDSRRYYPHSGVVEYGKFGNLHKVLASGTDEANYFDFVSGVFSSDAMTSNSFLYYRETAFDDPNIPEDAGVVFIITPSVDALSQEVLDNLKHWLSLGDRNLVLVGNDPEWERDGAYKPSNDIINNILSNLGSRVRIHTAKNQQHALFNPVGVNVVAASVPEHFYDAYSYGNNMYASGVGDIRFHDPSISTFNHSCNSSETTAEEVLNYSDVLNPYRLSYDAANMTCELPIKHSGDLRAQWYDLCLRDEGRFSANYMRTPMNIQAAYGIIPGLVGHGCHPGYGCWVDEICKDLWKPKNENALKAPTPVLAAAERRPDYFKVIPGNPATTITVQTGFNEVVDGFEIKESFAGNDFSLFAFNVSGIFGSTSYSGTYDSFDTNYESKSAIGGEFFKPEDLDETYILQSRDVSTTRPSSEDSLASDLAYIAAEELFQTDPDKKPSYVSMVATLATESESVLTAGDQDKMIYFYKNLISNGLDFSNNGYGAESIKLGQLGSWTNRTSFESGYDKTHLFNSRNRGIFQTAGLFNGTRGASGGIDLTIEENVTFGSTAETLADFDVLWIANTSSRPSNDDINKLKGWLSLGNKRLIITYGHSTNETNQDPLKPSQSNADSASVVCNKLNLDMQPLYLPGRGRYAEYFKDSTLQYDLPSMLLGDNLTDSNFNQNNNVYSSDLPTMFSLSSTSSNRFLHGRTSQTLFTPIKSNVSNYIAFYGPLQYSRIRPRNIMDATTIDQLLTYNNPGWSELVGTIPAHTVSTLDTPGASGYTIRVSVATESPSERDERRLNIVVDGLARKVFNQITQEYQWSVAKLNYIDENVRYTELKSFAAGMGTIEDILDDKVIDFGPFYATNSEIKVYVSTLDYKLRNTPSKLLGPRITSISVHPTEIIKTKTDKIVREPIFGRRRIPATPDTTVNIGGGLREISSKHDIYCPSLGDECLSPFDVAFNKRNGPIQLTDPFANASGIDVNVTKDGPVIATQEFELLSSFSAGVARSRITVLSDSSLIQGYVPFNFDDTKKREHIYFLESLYPYTDFPEDVIYNIRSKITAPERGSPAKWYGATGNSGLISRFIYNTGVGATTYAANQFTDLESHYDPKFVVRPLEFCECDNAPYPCIADELEANYNSGLLGSIHPLGQFTTVVSGKRYFDDLQLFKDTGDDYLDFDKYSEGYPGDLFGYSVALHDKRLLVGAPFSAFSAESNHLEWSSISGVPSGQVPTGVELSSNGGAGNVYMFEKTLTGSGNTFNITQNNSTKFLRQQFSEWQYIRKFRPSSINVGQDLTSALVSQSSVYYGTNTYADADITTLSPMTDRFGHALDIDSGIIAIGAPGHDFGNYIVVPSSEFMSKAFDSAFPIPIRTVYDLGTSGSRSSLPNSGTAILNNGAVYVYSEDYNFQTDKYEWTQIEKIVPQGNKTQTQKEYSGFSSIPVSGSENSHFGEAVSVSRYARSDSDYAIGIGSKNHLFSSGTEASLDRGAAYTYDIMLRKLPPAAQPTGAFINAKLFSEPSGIDGSAIQPLYSPILLNIINSGLNSQLVEQTGIIVTNNAGEIYLEVSGQDPSIYQYIKHRPYINVVDGAMVLGSKMASGIRMFIEGRPLEASGTPSGLALFVKPSATGVYADNVYNNTGLGMSTFGATGFASGLPSGLYLYNLGPSS